MSKETSIVIDYIDGCDNPTWEEFHELYPEIDEWEYELGNKEYQEM